MTAGVLTVERDTVKRKVSVPVGRLFFTHRWYDCGRESG
jgi:hypothetical protein